MSHKRICRVAGIAIKDNHVLIHRRKDKDYWTFPGGGCKFYETTKDALERPRMLWKENFYPRLTLK